MRIDWRRSRLLFLTLQIRIRFLSLLVNWFGDWLPMLVMRFRWPENWRLNHWNRLTLFYLYKLVVKDLDQLGDAHWHVSRSHAKIDVNTSLALELLLGNIRHCSRVAWSRILGLEFHLVILHAALRHRCLKGQVNLFYLQVGNGHDADEWHDETVYLSTTLEVEGHGDRLKIFRVAGLLSEHHPVEIFKGSSGSLFLCIYTG